MRTPLTWVLVGWLLSCAAAATADDSQIERATLAGLTPISVVVEGLAPIAEKNGLTGAAIQADTERRLRQAGISVTSDADAYLYVNVTVADPGASSPLPYVVNVTLMRGDAPARPAGADATAGSNLVGEPPGSGRSWPFACSRD